MNPIEYTDGLRILGIAMIVVGAGLLIFAAVMTLRKKPECNCD